MSKTSSHFSNSLRISHLVLLYITTCGLYFFYWFYQTNKQLYGHQHINNKPLLRTLGLIVPLLNIYLLWVLFRDIEKFMFKATLNTFKHPAWLTVAFILCSALYRLPALFSFIGFSSILPILYTQSTLNTYWQKEQPTLAEKTKLTWQEILICVLGSILLILAIVGAGLTPPTQD